MTDLDQLERLAREAQAHTERIGEDWYGIEEARSLLLSLDADAAYIAACSPDQVLRLVAIARAADGLIRLAQSEPLADAGRRGMLTEAAYTKLHAIESALRAALSPEKETSAARTPEAR